MSPTGVRTSRRKSEVATVRRGNRRGTSTAVMTVAPSG